MPCDEKPSLRVTLPNEDSDLRRILRRPFELRLAVEVLEQEPYRRFHPVPFELPQTYLVYYRGGDDGSVLVHLRMCMGGEVGDYLIGRDTHTHGSADGFSSYLPGDHVRVAGIQPSEELKNSDLEIGGGVSVEAVVCFYDDEAGGVLGCGGERGAETGGVGGESCGEASGGEGRGGRRGLIDYSEVAKVEEHLDLGGGEICFGVREAEFEGAEHEEEGEYVDGIHV